jgi:hypothetical protein
MHTQPIRLADVSRARRCHVRRSPPVSQCAIPAGGIIIAADAVVDPLSTLGKRRFVEALPIELLVSDASEKRR